MRNLAGHGLILLAMTACMANGDSAAGQAVSDIRIEDGPQLSAPRATHQLLAAGDTAPEIFDVASGTPTRVDHDLGGQWTYMTLVKADARMALLAGGYREGRIEPTDRSWIIRFGEGAAS